MPDNGARQSSMGERRKVAKRQSTVHALAEKVYALMLKEVRLGHARTESTAAPKRFLED